VAAEHHFCVHCGTSHGDDDTIPPEVADLPETEPTAEAAAPPETAGVRVTADGERRHLSLMFCDLVGSTSLSESLDVEDFKELVKAYQRVVGAAIDGEGGYVGHFMGDGVLAYFGYPVADELASVRAIRAGFTLLDAVADLRAEYPGIEVRVGIHSGETVVTDMGVGDNLQLSDVVGDAPNIAARIQALAEPGTIAVSSSARHECEGFIEFRSIGRHELKGVSERSEVFRPVSDSGADDRLELAASQRRLTPLVGRDEELEQLVGAWRRTRLGDPQVVWISGEPGIGKTRLVRELLRRVRRDGAIEIEFRCSMLHQASHLYSAAEQFRRYLLAEHGALTIAGIEALADTNGTPRSLAVPVVADLVGIPLSDPYRPLDGSADRIREQTLEIVARLVEDRAQRQPVVVVIDDIQWIDDTTAELVERFIGMQQCPEILTIVTYRSDFVVEIPAAPHHLRLELDRLEPSEVDEIITSIADGADIPATLKERISSRTDGVPLFAEELTQLVLASADDAEPSVPATLRDSLMARIDRLGPEADVLRILSIFGREAPEDLLHAVSGLDRVQFSNRVERLVAAGMTVRRGSGPSAVHAFRHALQQDVAYESMLRSTRRQLHARVASALESRFVDRSLAEPEVSARHFERAGEPVKAVGYLLRAGDRAIAISAHAEALTHLSHARELVAQLPDGPDRDRLETSLLVKLGVPTTATKGYGSAEAEQMYVRAQELALGLGDDVDAYPALYGLFRVRLLQAKYEPAESIAQRLDAIARANPHRTELTAGSLRALGGVNFYRGRDHRVTLEHLAAALELPDAQRPGAYLGSLTDVVDPTITCRSYAAWTHWMVGDPEEARRLSDESISAARRLAHPFTLCLALSFDTWLCQFEGDPEATVDRAEEAAALSVEHGFSFWFGWTSVMLEWGRAARGDSFDIGVVWAGIDRWQATGSRLGKTYFLGLAAHIQALGGDLAGAASTLDQALELVDALGEHFWEAELLRLRAEVARSAGDAGEGVVSRLVRARSRATSQRAQALADRVDESLNRRTSEFV
jgi:class 3 adenylate cyclase